MDRSIERVRMTAIWPSARMIRIEVSLKTVARLAGRAKPGKRVATSAISAAMATISQTSRCLNSASHPRDSRGGLDERLGVEVLVVVDGSDAPFAHDDDAIGHAEDLGQFGRDHDDGQALGDELGHEAVHGGLGADVDALGRLVEDDDLRLRRQPFGDDDLLLVAAGQRADILAERGCPQVEAAGVAPGEVEFFLQPKHAGSRGALEATAGKRS